MRWLIFFGILFTGLFVQGQNVVPVNNRTAIANLSPHAYYLEDKDGMLSLEQLMQPSMAARLQPVSERIINFGVTSSVFWIQTNIQNNTDENLLLEIGNYSLTQISVFETAGSRVVKQYHTGNAKAFSERLLKHTSFLFPLAVKKGERSTVYIRVMHYRGTQFPLKTGSISAFYEKDTRRNLMEGLYYGFMLIMVLYNLFLYFSLRDAAYLFYVMYIFFIALLNATINGYAFQYLWPTWPLFNQYDDVVACLAGSAGVLFASTFLDTRKNAPVMHRVFMCLLAVYFLSTVLIINRQFQTGIVLIEVNTLVLVVSFFVAAWHTLRNGYKPAKFFLIAWSFLLLSVFIFILNNFSLVPSSTYATHSLQIGSAVEALLLSFALANRINVYKEEKRKAHLAMLHSLEKNKKLIEEQNTLLERKVAERTNELKKANGELVTTLQNLKEAQAQLVQKEKMASLGELTAGIAHEIQNPLNFVNNFSEISTELVDELIQEVDHGEKHVISGIADNLKDNLGKIIFHGKRADSIVKSMLQHSHMRAGVREKADLNKTVSESLQLAYHGLRAADKNFTAIIETHFDESIDKVEMVTQDISRVLLNIFNNAFYSLREKKKSSPADYQPMIAVCTRKTDHTAVISIRDNGLGIGPAVRSKIYQPFFTTKPAGEGTGLGLSLSYDIITKEHNGTLSVNTEEGQYAEFIIQIPATL